MNQYTAAIKHVLECLLNKATRYAVSRSPLIGPHGGSHTVYKFMNLDRNATDHLVWLSTDASNYKEAHEYVTKIQAKYSFWYKRYWKSWLEDALNERNNEWANRW